MLHPYLKVFSNDLQLWRLETCESDRILLANSGSTQLGKTREPRSFGAIAIQPGTETGNIDRQGGEHMLEMCLLQPSIPAISQSKGPNSL